MLHLPPARFGLQSVPFRAFCLLAFSSVCVAACVASFCCDAGPESCPDAAGTERADAINAAQKSLFIRFPFLSTDKDFGLRRFYQIVAPGETLTAADAARAALRSGAPA